MTRQRRFLLAVAVTVFAVAYVVVPFVANLIEGMATYSPGYYEPKDFARMDARERRITDPASWTPETLVKAGLFVLLAVVWYIAASGGRSGGHWR